MNEKQLTQDVEAFVAFAYTHGSKDRTLTKEESELLIRILNAAGMEAQDVRPGVLRGHWLEQDGSKTGETYSVNSTFPFIVAGPNGVHAYFTGWLDSLAWAVKVNREDAVAKVLQEIERARPLKPIILTTDDDELHEYPPSPKGVMGDDFLVDHTRDEDELSTCVGVHGYCQGWVDRGRVTKDKDVLVCRCCHLRVTFPRTVKTYGELRAYLAKELVGIEPN